MSKNGDKSLVPRNYQETHAREKANEKPMFSRPKLPGNPIPAFNGNHKGSKKRPITLAKHA